MTLDRRTASLIAVGASITANCQPCLEINATRALKCGANPQEVEDAVEIGKLVRGGAVSKMDAFTASLNVPGHGSVTPGDEKCGCRSSAPPNQENQHG